MILIQDQVPQHQPVFPISGRQPSLWRGGAPLPWSPEGLTCALRIIACPGAVDRAVPAKQACGIVAFPTLIDDGAGENQAVAEQDSGIAWSPRIPTRDH